MANDKSHVKDGKGEKKERITKVVFSAKFIGGYPRILILL